MYEGEISYKKGPVDASKKRSRTFFLLFFFLKKDLPSTEVSVSNRSYTQMTTKASIGHLCPHTWYRCNSWEVCITVATRWHYPPVICPPSPDSRAAPNTLIDLISIYLTCKISANSRCGSTHFFPNLDRGCNLWKVTELFLGLNITKMWKEKKAKKKKI